MAESLRRYLSTGRKFYASDRQVSAAVTEKAFYFAGRPAQRKTLLAWLEKLVAGKEPASLDAATIEHIMPQTLSDEWRQSLSVDLGEFGALEDMHEAYVHSLANLTLSGYNSEAGNAPFTRKKMIFEESNIALTRDVAREETWGRTQILSRGQRLAKLITDTWIAPLKDEETVESGIAWTVVGEILDQLPAGTWTSYGALAAAAGTHPVPLGVYLSNNALPNAWRVLKANGAVAPSFRWAPDSPHLGSDVVEVLRSEGIRFDASGHASEDQRLGLRELSALIGVEVSTDTDAPVEESSDDKEQAYLAQLGERFPAATVHGVIEAIRAWRSLGGYVSFGDSKDIGAFFMLSRANGQRIWPLVAYSYGSVETVFQWLMNRPPFDDPELREELRSRLNRARGVEIGEGKLDQRPTFSLDVLADLVQRERLVDALEWFVETVAEYDRTASEPSEPAEGGRIEFTMAGEARSLSATDVISSLELATPDGIVTYWVDIDGQRWPVKQAMSLAVGVPTSEFSSFHARKYLGQLGFEIGRR